MLHYLYQVVKGCHDRHMGLTDWNWTLVSDVQNYPWDCSAASTAWALRAIGRDYSEEDVIWGLGPGRISPTYGLLDASGAGIVEWLQTIGVAAGNDADASWQEVQDAAGYQPLVIGGRRWCHWVSVRIGSQTAGLSSRNELWLMNPAPGYDGVDQILDEANFDRLGTFSAVWFESW